MPHADIFIPIGLFLGCLSLLIYYTNQTLVEFNLEDQRDKYDQANIELGNSYVSTVSQANLHPQIQPHRTYSRSCTIV